MDHDGAMPLGEILRGKRDAIVGEWLAQTLRSYPEHTGRFLSRERDPFRNPVGAAFQDALPVLFDAVLGGVDTAALTPPLDRLVRIRAVQDFTPGQAIAFLFLLRPLIREALRTQGGRGAAEQETLAAVEDRIDAVALLAFDLFMKCRERLYEIRTNEARRRIFLLERRLRPDACADLGGLEVPLEP